ncbi:hypothetical protein FH972_020793 [Carpinus fangiana]|uniref:Epidermal patterning factor-like protein n=1 Tax=Carpinus fangiana TaxID=176857 RepID=A0A5N6RXI0_9ROSI|nr:hypothetical protein FH972_020793 [Carpinus fangiana]
MKVVNSWATFLMVLVLLQQSLKEVGADLISDTCAKIDKSDLCAKYLRMEPRGTSATDAKELTHVIDKEFEKRREEERWMSLGRRFLIGSSPPQCTSKCGKCTPCKPVLVRVPPRTPVTSDSEPYDPLVWRCKCGNKLYIP